MFDVLPAGSIPKELGALEEITFLGLSHNRFTGEKSGLQFPPPIPAHTTYSTTRW